MTSYWSRSTRIAAPLVAVALLAVALCATGIASAKGGKTLYVSPKGKTSNPCTAKKPCKTIGEAVGKAKAGDTIMVKGGIYKESVSITKRLSLIGTRKAVINAKGKTNGVAISGKSSARSLVRGFTVENAVQEGIVATSTSHVTITGNTVTRNDRGAGKPGATGECAANGQIPGDCGEGLHLMGTTHSTVSNNRVTHNSGGILVSDETGPSAHNSILDNKVAHNVADCGITVVGHNPGAFSGGKPQPKAAGVYANLISGNTVNGNGVKGKGGGILLATAGPGTAVYNNHITGNKATGNGLAGITLHSHAPGDDLNGNVITANTLGRNAIGGKGAKAGDPDTTDTATTGLLISSAVTKLSGTVVKGNKISNDHFGIWTKNVPKIKKSANTFHNVKVPVHQE